MAFGDKIGIVGNLTELVGILHHSAEEALVGHKFGSLAGDDLDTARGRIGAHHVERLGEDAFVDKDFAHIGLDGGAATAVVEHNHTFAASSGFVEKRCVGQRHLGHVGHHGLIGHQGLKSTLADLGLVRRIGGIPAGVFKHVALDDGRGNGVVVTHTDIALEELVFLGQATAAVQKLVFVDTISDGHGFVETDRGGHSLVDQFIHGVDTDGFQHFFFVGGFRNAIVTRCKIIGYHIVK